MVKEAKHVQKCHFSAFLDVLQNFIFQLAQPYLLYCHLSSLKHYLSPAAAARLKRRECVVKSFSDLFHKICIVKMRQLK